MNYKFDNGGSFKKPKKDWIQSIFDGTIFKYFFILWIAGAVLSMGIIGFLIWIIWHFVSKYW